MAYWEHHACSQIIWTVQILQYLYQLYVQMNSIVGICSGAYMCPYVSDLILTSYWWVIFVLHQTCDERFFWLPEDWSPLQIPDQICWLAAFGAPDHLQGWIQCHFAAGKRFLPNSVQSMGTEARGIMRTGRTQLRLARIFDPVRSIQLSITHQVFRDMTRSDILSNQMALHRGRYIQECSSISSRAHHQGLLQGPTDVALKYDRDPRVHHTAVGLDFWFSLNMLGSSIVHHSSFWLQIDRNCWLTWLCCRRLLVTKDGYTIPLPRAVAQCFPSTGTVMLLELAQFHSCQIS